MSTYSPTPEGVEALRGLSDGLEASIEMISSAVDFLQGTVEGQRGLGPHADSITEIIDQIRRTIKLAQAPIEDLCIRVKDVADAYQEIIDYDPFRGLI